MAQVLPLVRVTGTAHGTRTVDLPAKPAVFDTESGAEKYPAREASSYTELGVAVRGQFGDNVTDSNTGTLSVLLGDDAPAFTPGEAVDALCTVYVRWMPPARGGRAYPVVALRYVCPAESAAQRTSRPLTQVG